MDLKSRIRGVALEIIKSGQNPKVKLVRSLYENKGRAANNAFVVEGARFVDEITNEWKVQFYLVSEEFARRDIEKYVQNAPVFVADEKTFTSACDTQTPQGILAVCDKPDTRLTSEKLTEILQVKNPMFLLLENTQNPGNLGTAIRTADAVGATAVFVSVGSVDVFNPKVIRSAAGSVFHLPFFTDADILDIVDGLKRNGVNVYAASLEGAVSLYSLDLTTGCAFVIGNEAHGLKEETVSRCYASVKVPIIGKAESLNAAVAGGVLLYEAVRQRLRN